VKSKLANLEVKEGLPKQKQNLLNLLGEIANQLINDGMAMERAREDLAQNEDYILTDDGLIGYHLQDKIKKVTLFRRFIEDSLPEGEQKQFLLEESILTIEQIQVLIAWYEIHVQLGSSEGT